MTAPTITDTPESAIADGRCSFDVWGGPNAMPYLACGRPVVASWYATQWPGRNRTLVSALCAKHDAHAVRAAGIASSTIGGRMYEREDIK